MLDKITGVSYIRVKYQENHRPKPGRGGGRAQEGRP